MRHWFCTKLDSARKHFFEMAIMDSVKPKTFKCFLSLFNSILAENQLSDWASTHFALDSQKLEFSEALWMVGHFKSI